MLSFIKLELWSKIQIAYENLKNLSYIPIITMKASYQMRGNENRVVLECKVNRSDYNQKNIIAGQLILITTIFNKNEELFGFIASTQAGNLYIALIIFLTL